METPTPITTPVGEITTQPTLLPPVTTISPIKEPQVVLDKTISMHLNSYKLFDLSKEIGENGVEPGIPYEISVNLPTVIDNPDKGWNINLLLVSAKDINKIDATKPEYDVILQKWNYYGIFPILEWDDITYGNKIITFEQNIPQYLLIDTRKGYELGDSAASYDVYSINDIVFPVQLKITKNPIKQTGDGKILFKDVVPIHLNGFKIIELRENDNFLSPNNEYRISAKSPFSGKTSLPTNINILVLDIIDKQKFSAMTAKYDTINRKWDYEGITPVVQMDDVVDDTQRFTVDKQGAYYVAIDGRTIKVSNEIKDYNLKGYSAPVEIVIERIS
jgi:hypothetical protein